MKLNDARARKHQHEADRRELFTRVYAAAVQGALSSGNAPGSAESTCSSIARAAVRTFDNKFQAEGYES